MNHTTKKINTTKLLKTILSLAMVLSLLVGCSMMFAGCSGNSGGEETQPAGNKHDPAQYEGLNDKEYLQTLGYNYLSDATAAFAKGYDAYMGAFNGNASAGTKVGMTLTLGTPVLELLEDAAGGAMDFDFLSKISMDMDIGSKDQLTQAKVAIGLNGKNIATATMLMDAVNYAVYMGVPELSDTYIKMDLAEAMESTGAAINAESLAGAAAQLVSALPSGDEMAAILNRYIKIALAEMDNVKRAGTTLEVNGIQQECGIMTVKLYQEDILDICEAILKEAENDDEIKQIIFDVVEAAAEASGEEIDAAEIYDQFRDAVKNAQDMVEASREDLDTENYAELVFYIDANHNVIGLGLTMPGSEGAGLHYYTVTEGDKTAMEMVVNGYAVGASTETALKISGEGTIKSGKASGTYTVEVQGEEVMTVEVKNMTAESGTLVLKPSDEILDNITDGADLPFDDIALEIKLEKDGVELSALSGSKKLIGIALTVKESSVGSVKLPTKYVDGTDNDELMDWVSDANFNTLFNNLKKAGVPSDLVDSLGSMLGG